MHGKHEDLSSDLHHPYQDPSGLHFTVCSFLSLLPVPLCSHSDNAIVPTTILSFGTSDCSKWLIIQASGLPPPYDLTQSNNPTFHSLSPRLCPCVSIETEIFSPLFAHRHLVGCLCHREPPAGVELKPLTNRVI